MSRLNMARKIKELHRNNINENKIDFNNQQINEQNQEKKIYYFKNEGCIWTKRKLSFK